VVVAATVMATAMAAVVATAAEKATAA
jgi:hypothetical protein